MDTVSPAFPSVISPLQLAAELDVPGLLLLDVRRPAGWDEFPGWIPSARFRDPDAVETWLDALPRRPIVVYCAHGGSIGCAISERLAAAEHDVRMLTGGIAAWRDAGLATVTPPDGGPTLRHGPTRWVTRARPKIDRIACPWLIRRWIDPDAAFHYVPAGQVMAAADALAAIPYDVPGVAFTHRGAECSFDALVHDFGLATPVLSRLAAIIRAADTDRLSDAPQAAGLLAVSLGLGAMIADDLALLDAGCQVYDALYAWAARCSEEKHNWTYPS